MALYTSSGLSVEISNTAFVFKRYRISVPKESTFDYESGASLENKRVVQGNPSGKEVTNSIQSFPGATPQASRQIQGWKFFELEIVFSLILALFRHKFSCLEWRGVGVICEVWLQQSLC